MSGLPVLVTDLALILILAGIMSLICKKLRQPVIIGYVLAGFLLSRGAGFFPMFVTDPAEIEILAEIGVIFLMFSLGLEFNLHKMVKVGVSGTLAATIQIIGMVLIGWGIGSLLGWSFTDSIFLGGMLSMSSTIITVKAIEDCGMRDRKFASLSIGTLIIEDIAAIFLMMILSTLSVSQGGGADLIFTIAKLLFYLALWLVLGILIIPTFVQLIQKLFNDEILLIVSLAMCFLMVLIANAVGFSTALGAFMAGSLLSGTPVSRKTEKLISPCKDLFVAVFFVSVGFLVVPSTLVEYALPILLIIVITIAAKVFLLAGSYLLTRESMDTAIHCAFSQTQVGEFSFVIASMGLTLGVTSDFLYPVIVAVALITTFTTPFLLKAAPKTAQTAESILPEKLVQTIRERRLRENEREEKPEISLLWRRFLKTTLIQVSFYTLIAAGIAILGERAILPFLLEHFPYTATKIITAIIIIICMLPFLTQLFFSHNPDFAALWMESRFNRFPLGTIVGIRTAIGIGLIMLVPVLFFDEIHFWWLLLTFPIAAVCARSKTIRGSYLTIAAKFLANLNESQLHESSKKKELLWESEGLLVDIYTIPEDSPVAGQKIAALEWGNKFLVNIIRIQNDKRIINLPTSSETLHAGDVFCVYGAAQNVDNFRLIYNKGTILRQNKKNITLHEFIINQDNIPEKDQIYCYGTLIHRSSPFVNKNIQDSGLRKFRSCFVIGVEREHLPIHAPSPNLILLNGDIVWILGTVRTIIGLLEDESVIYHSSNAAGNDIISNREEAIQ